MAKHKTRKVDKVKISACYIVKDVAEDFGAKVFHEPWQDDFATPRNVALRAASGDWIVFLDADEYFVDNTAKNLRRVIKSAQAPGLLVKLVNIDKDNGNAIINSSYVLRLFKAAEGVT